mmetsp:Transcript_59678/g.141997  ORF Transcript_59678/g.141997 Transcript_59678/m.141997 type:complete len:470 (-) Transcript_59678:140-1549(-)
MRRSVENLLSSIKGNSQDESQWTVGMRYEVAQEARLNASIDQNGKDLGKVQRKDKVLVLAVAVQPVEPGNADEVVLAYLARTDMPHQEWVCGWAEIDGPQMKEPVLKRRHRSGSWEVGGRYIAATDCQLKAGVELETADVGIAFRHDEVLILSFSLLIRDRREPSLRAHVKTDSGVIGWMSVEVFGERPGLYPQNLYSESDLRPRLRCRFVPQMSVPIPWQRIVLQPLPTWADNQKARPTTWDVGGQYWTLGKKVWFREDADLHSAIVAQVGAGVAVEVLDIREVQRPDSDESVVRLKVRTEVPQKGAIKTGWVSGQDPHSQLLIDTRNHLEYDFLLRHLEALAQDQRLREAAAQKAALTPLKESVVGLTPPPAERSPGSEKDEDNLRANADASTDSPDASFQPPSSDQAVPRNQSMRSDDDEDEQELFDRRHRTEIEGAEGSMCWGRTGCCTTGHQAPYCFRPRSARR